MKALLFIARGFAVLGSLLTPVRTKMEQGGLNVVGNTPQQSAAVLKRTLESYIKVMKAGFQFE